MAEKKAKKKRRKGAGKGSAFERTMSKMLSLWWTADERDDIYWRTASSGGRATMRRQRGKSTFGGAGDVQAVDPIGQPLMDLCTIEIKCGYSTTSILDIVDRSDRMAKQVWDVWLRQVVKESRSIGGGWMLISKRCKREIMVFINLPVYSLLLDAGAGLDTVTPLITVNPKTKIERLRKVTIVGTTWSEFARVVTSDNVRKAIELRDNERKNIMTVPFKTIQPYPGREETGGRYQPGQDKEGEDACHLSAL